MGARWGGAQQTRKGYAKTLMVTIHLVAELWVLVFSSLCFMKFSIAIMSTYYVKNQEEKKLSQSQDLNWARHRTLFTFIPHTHFNPI